MEEAADILCTSTKTIRELIYAGHLLAANISARGKGIRHDYRISKWALEDYIRKKEAAHAQEVAARAGKMEQVLKSVKTPSPKGKPMKRVSRN